MAEPTTLELLQGIHRDLLAALDERYEALAILQNEGLLGVFEQEFEKFWSPPPRTDASRNAVKSGKITIDGEEYSINEEFRQSALNLSDEAEIDELEAARCLLDAQADIAILGRPLLECGIIRLHQQRKYALDIARILLELDTQREVHEGDQLEIVGIYVSERVLKPGSRKTVPRCDAALARIRAWLARLADKVTRANLVSMTGELETIEFSRVSLTQQHETVAVILCRAIEKKCAWESDFKNFLGVLQSIDRYDSLLIHIIPALGAYISEFASIEGGRGLVEARKLHTAVCPPDPKPWSLSGLQAAFRAWWLAEYGGHYMEDIPDGTIEAEVDLDEEDAQRSQQFIDALKDGSFDCLLSLASDVKSLEWQDPARMGMRQWLQRKWPPLPTDSIPFAEFFQLSLMSRLEVFVDSFISNLPDVLRKLRVEEDEQRQLSQTHEHDLNLERFLIIIAYAYEGRPEAAMTFWSDPDSNLAGFMHWASRRASTPLVTAFCEMLQAISENEYCATAAHEFLLDEGHHASGKMRKSLSLTWSQIFKELQFFSNKIREKPAPPPTTFRPGKPSSSIVETEPESAMMLECYLRLITKLATVSESVRQFLIQESPFQLVDVLYQLAGSQIPPRLRACTFWTLRALMTRKSQEEVHFMWAYLDSWAHGNFNNPGATAHHKLVQQHPPVVIPIERVLEEMSNGFEEPYALVLFLTELVSPAEDASPLNDSLPFPENLGSAHRMPGIDAYVDYVIGLILGSKSAELPDVNQQRMLRLSCLEFILTCLTSFNENLIVFASETSLAIDSAMVASDLAAYIRLHPFARAMEWMLNEKVLKAVIDTIHQSASEVGNASPDSPLIMGILRSIEVISKVLTLQPTFLDIVRPLIRKQKGARTDLLATQQLYSSIEDGLGIHLNLVVDLGVYCGLGHPDLTLACLQLLERLSGSSRIMYEWSSSPGTRSHRNKAIVAMEADGDNDAISRSFTSDLLSPLDFGSEEDSPSYMIQIYILSFLLTSLRQSPRTPSIAHLLLGFQCGIDNLSIRAGSPFEKGESLFHTILRLWMDTPAGDATGMRYWLVALKSKALQILQELWSSPISSPIVVEELRQLEFVFHLLHQEVPVQADVLWEGDDISNPEFPISKGAITVAEFLSHRVAAMEYVAMELCLVSQVRLPTYKRRIFEALNGRITLDSREQVQVATVFDLFDFILPNDAWDTSLPNLHLLGGIDINACRDVDINGNGLFDIQRTKEMLMLKRNENRSTTALALPQDVAAIDRNEALLEEYMLSMNRQQVLGAKSLEVLGKWTNLLLVMAESNDFQGATRTSFLLQTLQTILPSLEVCSTSRPLLAFDLSKLAKVLLFKLDLAPTENSIEKHPNKDVGHLVSDKLYQLFEICMQAIGRWAQQSELRSVYYSICYRYLTSVVDKGAAFAGRQKIINSIQLYGDKLANVICDDAFSGEASNQTAALILLGALVNLGRHENDDYIVEMLNRLNFIGIVVDSLKNIMQESAGTVQSGNKDQQHYHDAKLALLLRLCQTKAGAKYVLHANLFRVIEISGLFSADPELQVDPTWPHALVRHYSLLASIARIMCAALVSRGSHNILQGRRFLTEHRMLVTHTLKRAAGIGHVDDALLEQIEELADAFVVMVAATGFLDFEEESQGDKRKEPSFFFH